jgi:hypothetical protein
VDFSMPLRALVRETEGVVFEAVEHGDMPAWHVRRKIWPDLPEGFRRDPGVYFMYREVGKTDFFLDGLELEQIELAEEVDTPGLQFWMLEREGRVDVEVLHYLSEYPQAVAERAARCYLEALEALVSNLNEPIGKVLENSFGQGKEGEASV